MTPPAARFAVETGTRQRFPGEELAVLVVALLVLLLPGLLRREEAQGARLERFSVAPIEIDVERAPWYEWALLDGIGEVRARRIVEYRERHGPPRSLSDLARIPGLPAGWVEKAEPYLSLPSPAKERPGLRAERSAADGDKRTGDEGRDGIE